MRELKAFASVMLEPGEAREVVPGVRREDLAYWDIRVDRWIVEGGEYRLDVAASGRDLRSSTTVDVAGDEVVLPLTPASTIGEALAHPVAAPILQSVLAKRRQGVEGDASHMPEGVSMDKTLEAIPLGRVALLTPDMTPEMLDDLLAAANAPQE